ncbi:ArnT family glycosyltransferase [Pseudomonas knackmussii]|uniref:ArnT family glycosyltransferase n=1 Tax=Pseudomonas knackmussii TaxID=65741 RepID=UPI001362AD96|nr:glycosyltransferase family 39 protein [Pseudomonas knackmussii]
MKLFRTERVALALLLGVSALILLCGLGAREVWGPEARWADIALQMLQSHDYFDPYLMGGAYYDKPLLSYWLITAPASLFGLNHWTLRLSSVLAAWASIWLVYLLGEQLFRKGTGLIAGWLLATTFYFAFWARVATADLVTVCGILAALLLYWRNPDDTRFSRYLGFWLLLTLTSLFKGLIGFVLPALVLLPHLLGEGRWRKHCNLRFLAALLVSAVVYFIPFLLSHLYGQPTYGESGLYLVFRENVVRFFHPYDNFGPIYTYLIYLPVYTLPWAPFWMAGLWLALRNWKGLEPNVRWLVWALGLLFLFFTASGSRRSYYVLPLVPFAQLLAAWWIVRRLEARQSAGRGWAWAFGGVAILLLLVLGVIYPWSNGGGGVITFADQVRSQATRQAPWPQWQVVIVDGDNKLPMYLQGTSEPFFYVRDSADFPREGDSAAFFAWLERYSGRHWDPLRTVVIGYYPMPSAVPLSYLEADHQRLLTPQTNGARLFKQHEGGSVAYIPADSVSRADAPSAP